MALIVVFSVVFYKLIVQKVGRDCSASIATRYGMRGLENKIPVDTGPLYEGVKRSTLN